MAKLNNHQQTAQEEEEGVVVEDGGGHGHGRGYNKDSFLVQDRLSKLCKKSDENRHKNDDLVVHPHGHAPSLHKKKEEEQDQEPVANEKKKEATDDHHPSTTTTIELQRDSYLAERPTGWLGGGEPTEQTFHHNEPHHKARSRPTWMMTNNTNAKGSMSLRNVYSPPESLHHHHHKSSKIQEKMSAFEKGGN